MVFIVFVVWDLVKMGYFLVVVLRVLNIVICFYVFKYDCFVVKMFFLKLILEVFFYLLLNLCVVLIIIVFCWDDRKVVD